MSLTADYAAGLMDGEGYIGIRCHGTTYAVIIKLAMTDKGAYCLQMVRDAFGGCLNSHQPSGERQRPVTEWTLSGRHAAGFLELIRPFLLVKAESADIALELQAVIDAAPRNGTRPHALWDDEMRRKAARCQQRIKYANRVGPDPGHYLPAPERCLGRAAGWGVAS